MKHRYTSGIAALTLSLYAQAAAAMPGVDYAKVMPPPGLYRIDSEGSFGWNAAPGVAVQQKIDGATGAMVDRRTAGGASSERVYKGSGAVTHCVKLVNKQAMALPAALAGNCQVQSTSAIKDGVVHQAACPGGATTLTVLRIDSDTWEYRTEVQTGGATPTLATAIKPVLEHTALHGATADERAKAAQQLKELPAMQDKMTAERAAAADIFNKQLKAAKSPQEVAALKAALAQLQGGVPMHSQSRERWTRIGNICDSF